LTTPLATRLLDRLVEELTAEGDLTPQWRETFWPSPAISSYLTPSGNMIRPSMVRTTWYRCAAVNSTTGGWRSHPSERFTRPPKKIKHRQHFLAMDDQLTTILIHKN
jgi:hypothetical protein